jgi:hypothetical protein
MAISREVGSARALSDRRCEAHGCSAAGEAHAGRIGGTARQAAVIRIRAGSRKAEGGRDRVPVDRPNAWCRSGGSLRRDRRLYPPRDEGGTPLTAIAEPIGGSMTLCLRNRPTHRYVSQRATSRLRHAAPPALVVCEFRGRRMVNSSAVSRAARISCSDRSRSVMSL